MCVMSGPLIDFNVYGIVVKTQKNVSFSSIFLIKIQNNNNLFIINNLVSLKSSLNTYFKNVIGIAKNYNYNQLFFNGNLI